MPGADLSPSIWRPAPSAQLVAKAGVIGTRGSLPSLIFNRARMLNGLPKHRAITAEHA